VEQMKSRSLLHSLAVLWTLFSAFSKKEKMTHQNETNPVIATPNVTKSAERIICAFP